MRGQDHFPGSVLAPWSSLSLLGLRKQEWSGWMCSLRTQSSGQRFGFCSESVPFLSPLHVGALPSCASWQGLGGHHASHCRETSVSVGRTQGAVGGSSCERCLVGGRDVAGEGGTPKPTAGACSVGRGPLAYRERQRGTGFSGAGVSNAGLSGRKPVREGERGLVPQRWHGPESGRRVEREGGLLGCRSQD